MRILIFFHGYYNKTFFFFNLTQIIEPKELRDLDLSAPHTLHCLADGDVMVSTMGDAQRRAKGSFALIDTRDWKVKGAWLLPIQQVFRLVNSPSFSKNWTFPFALWIIVASVPFDSHLCV